MSESKRVNEDGTVRKLISGEREREKELMKNRNLTYPGWLYSVPDDVNTPSTSAGGSPRLVALSSRHKLMICCVDFVFPSVIQLHEWAVFVFRGQFIVKQPVTSRPLPRKHKYRQLS